MTFSPAALEVAVKVLCPAIKMNRCDDDGMSAELPGVGAISVRQRWGGEWAVTMGTCGTNVEAPDAMAFATGMMQLAAAVVCIKGAIIAAGRDTPAF
jgi:hypothetical protein